MARRVLFQALVDAKPETRGVGSVGSCNGEVVQTRRASSTVICQGLGVEVTEFEQMLEDIRQDHSEPILQPCALDILS